MAAIPLSIAKYVRSIWMAEMIITYIQVDKEGNLVLWRGYPQHYGLTDLAVGQPVTEQAGFLEGMLDVPHTQVLEFMGVGGGRCAHIHIIPLDNGTGVLMFDATAEHDRQQQMQQQLNELSIFTYRQTQLIQELEVARYKVEEEKEQLEDAIKSKSNLIATLSHELRTPLTSIVDYTKLLDKEAQQEASVPEAPEENYLASVKSNANHLLSLIDNTLEQVKLEAGQVVLQPSKCDIKQLGADLNSLFFPTAQEKGLLFEIDIKDNLPTQVMIDELRFRQVLINLMTNGLKFTEKGFVQATIGWQNGHLNFSVTDSGPGISQDTQQKIFTAFQREDIVNGFSGAGLGLAISHHLVKLMGGELTVDSSPKFGSTFSGFIIAPLAQHSVSSHERKTDTSATGVKILIADDSVDIRTLMEIYLEDGGYTVISADNGVEAVDLALSTQPNLVLMDMQMPVMNGYDAVQQLRAKKFASPIIALSGSTVTRDQKYALEVGCQQYLVKPVSSENLLKAIEEIINDSTS